MAVDKLVDSAQLDADLASVAAAIRTKGGTSAQLTFPSGFVSAIQAIPTGGGGGMNVQVYIGPATRKANSYGATSATLTVKETGTYDISWVAWRSSSTGTMGTNLHIGSTAETANHETFTGTYGQAVTLSGQRLTKGQVLTIYATSGSTSRTLYVANLIIEQTA